MKLLHQHFGIMNSKNTLTLTPDCLKEYYEFINDFENHNFDEHYWTFSDQSFLRILENLFKVNIIPYKILSFYPTPYNNNTFGVVLELNKEIQENSDLRQSEIDKMRCISKILDEKHFEIDQFVHLKKRNSIMKILINITLAE